MNEYETIFKDFKSGLRPTSALPVGTDTLVECYNAKAGEHSLEAFEPLTEPAIDPPAYHGVDVPWPFPQIIGCRDYAFTIYRNPITLVDDIYLIASDWSLAHIAQVPSGYGYEVIDFGTFVALTNGLVYIWYDPTLATWRSGNYTLGSTLLGVPVPRTWCTLRGQIVAGNFTSIPAGDWWQGFGENTVGWSNIGEVSFQYDLRNVAGHRPMPWAGKVKHVLPLRTGVIIYTTGGVGLLKPVNEPAVTFQFEELSNCGVLDTDVGRVVAGNLDGHIYLDKNCQLNRISANFKTELLQYEEFLSSLIDPVISMDTENEEFYLSDPTNCYVLTKYGLSSCHQRVSSVTKVNGGIYATLNDNYDTELRLTHHPIDFGMRGQKTLFTLEHGLEAGMSFADVEWRIAKNKDFRSSGWKLINSQGISTHKIAGTEFQLVLRASSYEDVKLSYVKARWKMTDMRSIRGVYIPKD